MATHQKHRVENSKNKTDIWMLQQHEMCNFHEYIFSNCTSEFWFCSKFFNGNINYALQQTKSLLICILG